MASISRRVLERRVGASYSWNRHQPAVCHAPKRVCKYWEAGKCTRNPCSFLHPDKSAPMRPVVPSNNLKPKQPYISSNQLRVSCKRVSEEQNLRRGKQRTSPENVVDNKGGSTVEPFAKQNDGGTQRPSAVSNVVDKPSEKQNAKNVDDAGKGRPMICEEWINSSCIYGEKCKKLHNWCYGKGLSKMVQLEGLQKAVTGINLPSGSDKLFVSSEDGTVRTWNCHTGECIGVADLGAPVRSLISEGPWVFGGMTNAVKAWNIKTETELTLHVPAGQVCALAASDKTLFAGLQDGSILAWSLNSDNSSFEGPSSLKGHTGAVVSLFCGANWLYSGSADKTIRVWDLENLLCIHTLQKHSDVITSVICWEQYLLSCSLDKTLKVWALNEAGEMEVVYTHNEDQGIISLFGMHDPMEKPILLCSCADRTVRIYDLPSFVERGRIFAQKEVRSIHNGPGGQFFTGDGTGAVCVWRWS